jgi:hypothetical protein
MAALFLLLLLCWLVRSRMLFGRRLRVNRSCVLCSCRGAAEDIDQSARWMVVEVVWRKLFARLVAR